MGFKRYHCSPEHPACASPRLGTRITCFGGYTTLLASKSVRSSSGLTARCGVFTVKGMIGLGGLALTATSELYLTMGALLALCFFVGMAAVVAGVGGGVMFVPLATALFAIHVDFIRGAGLMVALVGAISSAPALLSKRLGRPSVSIPLALSGSLGSIAGARIGLVVPERGILIALGVLMLSVAIQTVLQARSERSRSRPDACASSSQRLRPAPDACASSSQRLRPAPLIAHQASHGLSARLARGWGLYGVFEDPADGSQVRWEARRLVPALLLFVGVGAIGGMLGVGAGWANVPVLVTVMGLPVKMAAATSGLIILANSSAAAWIYLQRGAIDPLIVVPAVSGMIVGTKIGARLLGRASPDAVRALIVALLSLAGVRTLWGAIL